MTDNIYQKLYDLVLEYDIKVIKNITDYSYGPITSYAFILTDGTEFTTRNIRSNIDDNEVSYIISRIEKHHERSRIVSITNLIGWLNNKAERVLHNGTER